MRRSLEEPNSLRATAPIIATSSFQTVGAPRIPIAHDRVRKPASAFHHHARQFLAVSARPSGGKCRAILASARRRLQGDRGAWDPWRHIGGGRFIVNVRLFFTGSLGGGPILPLPS